MPMPATEYQVRREICDIGQRLYARGFAAGNDGNISYRLGDNRVLCTPTLICKGFMKPDDLCIVDLEGKQVAGTRRRTSEVLMHLAIYRQDPQVKAVVHCHPPHATAFGVARVDIPSCILPEVEVFLGIIPRADYETPGGPDFAATVKPYVGKANTVVLSNHGTVSWGESVEKAYWHTEILDAYCRILMLARQLGNVERLPAPKVHELLELREKFGGTPDPRRVGWTLCVNTAFAAEPLATEQSPSGSEARKRDTADPNRDRQETPGADPNRHREGAAGADAALVREVTARVLAALERGA